MRDTDRASTLTFPYRQDVTRANFVKAGLGLAFSLFMFWLLGLGLFSAVIALPLALIFFAFGVQTEIKRRAVLTLNDQHIQIASDVPLPGPISWAIGHAKIDWSDLVDAKLRFYGKNRKGREPDGLFLLTLRDSSARRLRVDSGQERFGRLVEVAVEQWRGSGGQLDTISEANLALLEEN